MGIHIILDPLYGARGEKLRWWSEASYGRDEIIDPDSGVAEVRTYVMVGEEKVFVKGGLTPIDNLVTAQTPS